MSSWSKVERKHIAATLSLLAVVILFFILPQWITLNRWIPTLSETFQQSTGRSLSLREIRLSFWSGPELQLFNLEIGGKEGEKPLASIGKVRIGFQLLPLLRRQFVIREIHLIDPLLYLSHDREGEWNIEALIPKREAGKPGGWKISNQSSEISFTRGELTLIDQTVQEGPIEWSAKEINGAASRFWLGQEIRLKLDVASIWRGKEAGKAARVGLTGTLQGDRKTFDFKRGTADLIVTLTGFDFELIRPYLRSKNIPPFIFKSGTFHIEANSADLFKASALFRSPTFRLQGRSEEGLVFLFPGLEPVAVQQAEWVYRDRQGAFILKDLQLRNSSLASISFELQDPFEKPQWNIETSGQIALPDLAEVLSSERFDINWVKRIKPTGVLEVAVTAKVPVKDSEEIDLKGRLTLKEAEFTPVASMKPVRKVEGEARFEHARLEVESVKGEWGGAPFKVTGSMPHILKKGVEFDFEAPFLDLEKLLLPASSPSKGEPKPKPEASSENLKKGKRNVPSKKRKGYVVGLVRINHFKVEGYDLQGFKSAVTYQERALQFQEVEAKVEGGILNVDFAQAYFNEDDTVSLAMTPNIRDVNFEEALKDFHRNDDLPTMSGRFMMMGGVNTEGRNFEEFKKNLMGNLAVYFEDGTLYRFKTLSRIFALMSLRRLPDLETRGLEYKVISGKLTIDKGLVTLHDTVIFGKDVRMVAKGTVYLPENRLDLEMGVQVFKLLDDVIKEIPVGSQVILGKDKMFIAAYFDVKGTIEDPEVRFRPLKSIQKSIFSILEQALKFPFKPRLFVKKDE
jgi:hypothetical protein